MKKQKLMQKIMFVLVIVFVIGIAPCGLEAKASIVDSGTCGAEGNEENVTWTFDSDGVLTISGEGAMIDYWSHTQPWAQYKNETNKIIIGEGITRIGRLTLLWL